MRIEIRRMIMISARKAFEGFLALFREIVVCATMEKLRSKEKSPFNRPLRYAELNYVFYRRLKGEGRGRWVA